MQLLVGIGMLPWDRAEPCLRACVLVDGGGQGVSEGCVPVPGVALECASGGGAATVRKCCGHTLLTRQSRCSQRIPGCSRRRGGSTIATPSALSVSDQLHPQHISTP